MKVGDLTIELLYVTSDSESNSQEELVENAVEDE